MQVHFENLEKIDDILSIVQSLQQNINTQKRWLSVSELSEYISYSKDRIYKLKDDVFIDGVHFYKKQGRVLFDRYEIDKWITSSTIDAKKKVDLILKDLTK